MNKSNDSINTIKQKVNSIEEDKEVNAIQFMLNQQQKYWNEGDIDSFMQFYWNSEELVFTSLKYKPTYGWDETLRRYKESYPDKESMGRLSFEILEIIITTKTKAKLKGKWELIREDDNPNGYFWLDLKKFEESWLITKDSTISLEKPAAY
tara:strand:- start:361 stop:813 length:453 start_codon:yes stop_codon:yes gene_type:complete